MNELINQQRDQIAQLTAQRDALAAKVKVFGTLIHEAVNGESAEPIATDGQITGYAVSYEWLEKVGAAIELPSQEHLQNLRAEAVSRAINLYTHKMGAHPELDSIGLEIIQKNGEYIHPAGLRDYVSQLLDGTDGECADSIRQEGK